MEDKSFQQDKTETGVTELEGQDDQQTGIMADDAEQNVVGQNDEQEEEDPVHPHPQVDENENVDEDEDEENHVGKLEKETKPIDLEEQKLQQPTDDVNSCSAAESELKGILSEEKVGETRCKIRRKGLIYRQKGLGRGKEGEIEPWLKWNTAWAAARNGDAVLLTRIVESDGKIANARNTQGESPLHFASKFGNEECARVLIELGAESFANERGKTPFEYAVERSYASIAKLLCQKNHLGTDIDSCKRLIAFTTSKSDFATMAVLQSHMNPTLKNDEFDLQRKRDKEAKREEISQQIDRVTKEVRNASILVPPAKDPPLGDPSTWAPKDVERWIEETVPDSKESLYLRAFSRYHITGAVLQHLSKGEIKTLLQRIGIPTPFRTILTVNILDKICKGEKRFGFTEMRLLPVALGNATAFRIIGFAKAAMSTPLQTCRRFVSASKHLNANVPLPESFVFVSMHDGQNVPRSKENSLLVSHIGFILIVRPSETKQTMEQDDF